LILRFLLCNSKKQRGGFTSWRAVLIWFNSPTQFLLPGWFCQTHIEFFT
jgi:hypothetical protein